jgi:polygalacturonase
MISGKQDAFSLTRRTPINQRGIKRQIPIIKALANSTKHLHGSLACWAVLALACAAQAGTVVWNGASGTNTNWSNGTNWAGSASPAAADDVKFFDAGAVATVSNINNVVDGAFNGTIGSLQYGNTNNFHTTLISAGQTLNLTGTNGLSVFMPAQDTAAGPAKSVFAMITGPGATLNLGNTNANLVINQSHTNSPGGRATLDLSGLDTFTANLNRLGIGTVSLPNSRNPGGGTGNQRCLGTLYLAKTNLIRLNYAVPLATYLAANATNALELSRNPGNNAGGISFLYLGRSNAFYLDSIGVGRDKASATAAGWFGFNPAFTNSNPTAYFRGAGGDSSRVTWWGIGDMNASGSSLQVSVGTSDFSNGTVDALVNVMSLARDGSVLTTAGANNQGVLTFTAGTVDVNTLYVGNQSLGGGSSGGNYNACIGIVNVNGSNATLVVNNNLVLGRTVTNSVTAQLTSGTLNINQGIVRANTITVGAVSTNNTINLMGGTLVVTNASGTNTVGTVDRPVTSLTFSNAMLWLSVNSNGVPSVAVSTLRTSGTTNSIGLVSVPIFPAYPTQLVLIKYTTLDSYGFGLANSPASAPGAYLVNNAANQSIDLVLTSGPTPRVGGLSFLQQPGDTVAGFPISPAVKVAATNSDGTFATNTTVFISLLSGTGVLNGSLSRMTDQNGVATFTDLSLIAAGSKSLRAAAGGKIAGSAGFNISAAQPASLVFTTQPIDTVAGQVITPAVTLQLLDAYGNNAPTNGIGVSLSLSSGSGTLSGTTSVNTDPGGQATFTNLSIDLTGTKQMAASASGLLGTTSRSEVILPYIPLPVIPNQTFFVTNYGATGDGVATNTVAIQNTINAASLAGGGTVRITPGVYLSGPLTLSNRINLQIDAGAMLEMLPYGSYPANVPNFISSTRLHDVAISGGGTIDGQGAPWWALFNADNTALRPHDMILMSRCTNVLVENVTLQNPPNFHLDLSGPAVNVNIRHITVNTPPSPNTDGIDFAANNCLVQYCSFNDGDDDPVLKGPAYNVTIADCNIGLSYGIAVGSTLANGGATNLYVVNCVLTNTIYAIDLKSDRDRGNLMQNFTFANLSMNNVQKAFIIYGYYTNTYYGSLDTVTPAIAALDPIQSVTATTPIWRDITFSNITVKATGLAGIIWGVPEMLVSNVTFTGVSISASRSFDVFNARGVRFVDSPITTPPGINNLQLYNAELTISNSAPVSTPVTLDGFSTNGNGNTLLFYNAPALVKNTNLFAANPAITLGGSILTVSNNLNLGAASSLNFVLGTNTTRLVVLGNLVLNGTINVSAGSGFTPNNYTLFSYSGSLGGMPMLGATPTVHSYNYTLDTNTPGQVNLVVAAPSPPSFENIQVASNGRSGTFILSGSGGVTNGLFYVLATTNLALPLAQWLVVDTNPFDASGRFLFTNVPGSNAAQMFYRLELP